MPRDINQRIKLLFLKQFFEEKTDEDHPATNKQIIEYLASKDIPVERKTVYTDIQALEEYGMEIMRTENGRGYYWTDRPFELPELKFIIDSVAASKFLSEKKSDALIKKLGTLASEHQQRELRRQVRVSGRVKTMNASILNSVDAIHAAIAANTTILFKYFHYNTKMDRVFSNKGKPYEVSRLALLYDNNDYYLLGCYDEDFRTYRVDRMAEIKQGIKERIIDKDFDISKYSKSTFGMYGGKEEKVEMVFQNRMLDAVIDKFGKDAWLQKVDDNHSKITATVSVSPQFFSWVFGLGNYIKIVGPDNVVEQMKKMLADVSKRYQ